MSQADDGLRALLQRYLPKPEWRWTPVESGGTHGGIPDSYYLHRLARADGWAECKRTSGWMVEMRPHQVQFLQTHAAAGVRCHVAVRARGTGSSRGKGDSLWLVRGAAAGELLEHGLRLDPAHVVGVWYGPPATWGWDAVAAALTAPGSPG